MSPENEPKPLIVARLAELLGQNGFTASPLLERIFARSARFYSPETRPLIVSSTSLLFGIFDVGRGLTGDGAEEKILSGYASLLLDHEEFLEEIRSQMFGRIAEADAVATYEPTDISTNVALTLRNACELARSDGHDGILLFPYLLMAFPPEGSGAEKILLPLGVSDWVRRAVAYGTEEARGPPAETVSVEAPAQPPPLAKKSAKRAPGDGGEQGGPGTAEAPPGDGGEQEGAGKTEKPPPTTDPAPVIDRVSTHADEPALIDQLERAPFARCLAQNIREARASGEGEAAAFIVHLHGPWGSGKSSVLNFLEAELVRDETPWLVVRFNAWRDQRRQPPWWSLITCIYAGARSCPDEKTAKRLWWRWFKWRVRADYMPWAMAAGLVALCVGLLILGVATSVGPIVTAIGGLITLIGAGAVAFRSLALGSQKAAQTYAELKADPFQPITDLFCSLIRTIERPVAVFIDDLDRCDGNYVVDLLEGIQTLMRSAPVTYVVAADRKWICSSFEQKYAKFSPPIGEPGRPLGYLFLDKIFQVSAAVPQLAADVREAYWAGLLGPSGEPSREEAREIREKAEGDARDSLAGLTTHEQLKEAVEQAERTDDPVVIQATRAEAAMRITSAEVTAKAEHRLKGYAPLLEPNPRSMKRLVNAYGMHQATLFLAGRSVAPDALARWTILELRWPLLADFIAVRPDYVDRLAEPLGEAGLRLVPERLRDLFGDELIAQVVRGKSPAERLDAQAVRSILGAVQGDR